MNNSGCPNMSMREILAALPSECIGPERLLSLALYQMAHDHAQSECIGAIFKLSNRYGRDATLQHLLLLPDKAYQWLLGGFERKLESQAHTSDDNLATGLFPYVAANGRSGYGWQVLAPKTWAAAFLSEATRKRPLPPSA